MEKITTLEAALQRIEVLQKKMQNFKKNWNIIKIVNRAAERSITPNGWQSITILSLGTRAE